MAVFIVLRPSLLTTKLKSVIRHNLGHSKEGRCIKNKLPRYVRAKDLYQYLLNAGRKCIFLKHGGHFIVPFYTNWMIYDIRK